MKIHPVTLEGRLVRLEPLRDQHAADLALAGADPAIWTWMSSGPVMGENDMRRHIAEAVELEQKGAELPFAVIPRDTGRAIGSTRYLDIRPTHRGLEIGSTWYAAIHQRTGVNTECKRLLLEHAFETLGCIRVQLKTDLRNLRSQRAIERLGAVKEGLLRNHMILPDGHIRTTVLYSITAEEWPTVKTRLQANHASPR